MKSAAAAVVFVIAMLAIGSLWGNSKVYPWPWMKRTAR
jgi:hypothetical protein